MTPEERAKRWADACAAKAANYTTGVRAGQAKYAEHLREEDRMAHQLVEILDLPETDERV